MELPKEISFVENNPMQVACPNLEDIRRNGSIPDLTIMVKILFLVTFLQGKDGGIVQAHRIILGARFPQLGRFLSGQPQSCISMWHWPRISSRISMENIDQMLSVAVQTKCHKLKGLCQSFMILNFDNFSMVPSFLSLDVNILCEILQSRNLVVRNEEAKFLAIANWIFHARNDEEEENVKVQYIDQLMSLVHWTNISPKFMIEQLTTNSRIADHRVIREAFYKAVQCSDNTTGRHVTGVSLNQEQTMYAQPTILKTNNIYIIGHNNKDTQLEGPHHNVTSSGTSTSLMNIVQLNATTQEKTLFGSMPVRVGAGLKMLKEYIFCIGGYTPATTQVDVFDLRSKTSYQVASMLRARRYFAAASSATEIVVCGGEQSAQNSTYLGFNEGLNPRSIRMCRPFPIQTSAAQASLRFCEVYSLKSNIWTELPQLIVGRSHFATVWTTDGRIYAIGGSDNRSQYINGQYNQRSRNKCIDSSSVEEYTCSGLPKIHNTPTLCSQSYTYNATIGGGHWRLVAPLPNSTEISSAVFFRGAILVCANPFTRLSSYAPSPLGQIGGLGQWTTIPTLHNFIQLTGQCIYLVVSSDYVYGFAKTGTVLRLEPSLKSKKTTTNSANWIWDTLGSIEYMNVVKGAVNHDY